MKKKDIRINITTRMECKKNENTGYEKKIYT